MAFKIDNQTLMDYITSFGVTVEPNVVRLIGIRSAVPYPIISNTPNISLQKDAVDHWNDTIGVWGTKWALFEGTVDPGAYWTQYPENPQGAAHLLPLELKGKPWRFVWGLHHGQYECLVQGEDFTVARDGNKDGEIEDTDPRYTGQFGIHIHYGGAGWSVGKWSAGCQVLFGGNGATSQWQQFYQLLKATGQKEFHYYLIDGYKLAQHLKLIP